MPNTYVNTVTLAGRLVMDPRTRSENGPCDLRIAVNRRVKNKQTEEWEDDSSFFTVICWGDQKEQALGLEKGQEVMVSGRLNQSEYEKDGQKRESVEVVANAVMVTASSPVVSAVEPEW